MNPNNRKETTILTEDEYSDMVVAIKTLWAENELLKSQILIHSIVSSDADSREFYVMASDTTKHSLEVAQFENRFLKTILPEWVSLTRSACS